MEFEWDTEKAASNIRKHDVTFPIATRVFLDPFVLEFDADDFGDEMRYNVVGMVEGRLVHVAFTMRGDIYRIISARAAVPHERRQYHEI